MARAYPSGGDEQPALLHDAERQRLVANLVEQEVDRVAVVALYDPLPPLGVADARADVERRLGGLRRRAEAGVAEVAVATRRLERLAEVGEHEVAAAAGV